MTRFGYWLMRFIHRRFPTKRADARCSFCGRGSPEGEPFAEGEWGAMICGECAQRCGEIIADESARRAETATSEKAASEPIVHLDGNWAPSELHLFHKDGDVPLDPV